MADMSIVVDDPLQTPGSRKATDEKPKNRAVESWIVDKVQVWEENRNNRYVNRWNQYYRMWRGIWSAEDRNRSVERSRIVPPALQQAIEAGVAEMEESIFHRKRWFDIEDDEEGLRAEVAWYESKVFGAAKPA